MGRLSDDLQKLGYERTGEESPIDEEGELWSDGSELVCDKTATVIDGNHYGDDSNDRKIYRYRNSENVKLPGGYIGSYEWGHDGDEFYY